MEILTIFIIGVCIGCFITTLGFLTKRVGTLRVDYSDPDSGPYLFLEIDSGKSHLIKNSKLILIDVNTKSYLSQD